MDRRPVQGAPRLSPNDSWDRLQPPLSCIKRLDGWILSSFDIVVFVFQWDWHIFMYYGLNMIWEVGFAAKSEESVHFSTLSISLLRLLIIHFNHKDPALASLITISSSTLRPLFLFSTGPLVNLWPCSRPPAHLGNTGVFSLVERFSHIEYSLQTADHYWVWYLYSCVNKIKE